MITSTSFRSLINGFLESVDFFPGRTALVVEGQSYTYLELYRIVSRIAEAILRNEQQPSPLAAVWAHRNQTAYAGLLGCLAAGKGYVPLNPKFPVERTLRMLTLSGCTTLIVGKECLPQLPNLLASLHRSLTIILPEVTDLGGLASQYPAHLFVSGEQLPHVSEFSFDARDSDAIAYLLFTSGSTGEPKGVPISQENARAYVDYVCDRYQVNECDRFSQQFDLTFDLSVHDMFVCWERGACLCCVPDKSLMAPAKFIRDQHLTMWFSVPSVAGLLAKMHLLAPGCFPSLRCSLFCGEPLLAPYAEAWQQAAPYSIVENLYGPTETTIAISHYRWQPGISAAECVNNVVPIGQVFAGQHFLIADSRGAKVAPGEAGELCLSGSQVARGYWNNPEKTDERFVHFLSGRERLWYRTGDLVKQEASGNLCYLGRTDHQVKIRGFRVELQEIESVLRRACGTEQVVSVPWPLNNGSAEGIVAFVSGVQTLDQDRVRRCCGDVLPEYMVPRKIYLLDQLPLNANQKVDRGKLANLLGGSQT